MSNYTLKTLRQDALALGFIEVASCNIDYNLERPQPLPHVDNIRVFFASPVGYLMFADTYRRESQKDASYDNISLNHVELCLTGKPKFGNHYFYSDLSFHSASYNGDKGNEYVFSIHSDLKGQLEIIEKNIIISKNLTIDSLRFNLLRYCADLLFESIFEKQKQNFVFLTEDWPLWVQHMLGIIDEPDAVRPKIYQSTQIVNRISLKKEAKRKRKNKQKLVLYRTGGVYKTDDNNLFCVVDLKPTSSFLEITRPTIGLKGFYVNKGNKPDIIHNNFFVKDFTGDTVEVTGKKTSDKFASHKRDLTLYIENSSKNVRKDGSVYYYTDVDSLIRTYVAKQLHLKLLTTEAFNLTLCVNFLKENFTHNPVWDHYGTETKIDWKRLKKSFKQNFNRFKMSKKEAKLEEEKEQKIMDEQMYRDEFDYDYPCDELEFA